MSKAHSEVDLVNLLGGMKLSSEDVLKTLVPYCKHLVEIPSQRSSKWFGASNVYSAFSIKHVELQAISFRDAYAALTAVGAFQSNSAGTTIVYNLPIIKKLAGTKPQMTFIMPTKHGATNVNSKAKKGTSNPVQPKLPVRESNDKLLSLTYTSALDASRSADKTCRQIVENATYKLIETSRQCLDSVTELRGLNCSIAIDAECSSDEALCLVQIMPQAGRRCVYIFDVILINRSNKIGTVSLLPLRTLLEDDQTLKIGHDLRYNAILFRKPPLDATLTNVIDTQEMDKIIRCCNGAVQSDSRSLNEVLSSYKYPIIADKSKFHKRLEKNPLLWKNRPLSGLALNFAAANVFYIGDLCNSMSKQLGVTIRERSAARLRQFNYLSSSKRNKHDPHSQPCDIDFWLTFDEKGLPTYEPAVNAVDLHDTDNNSASDTDEDDVNDPDLETLLEELPSFAAQSIRDAIRYDPRFIDVSHIVDVKVDIGRPIVLGVGSHDLQLDIRTKRNTLDDYCKVLENTHFSDDNRGGISGTLHRVSLLRSRARKSPDNPLGNVIGFTFRIGRARTGNCTAIIDLLHNIGHSFDADSATHSVLLIGVPGSGKSTLLRSSIRYVAGELALPTVVVDTSNELGGEGLVPHKAILPARRMMVPDRRYQYDQLLEAVQNHTPRVIVVDELATRREVDAARSISQRGVAMLATVHGASLKSLITNPDLKGLTGGTETVTLGDQAASKDANRKRKTRTERAGVPPFRVAVELNNFRKFVIHHDIGSFVDASLEGKAHRIETRTMLSNGRIRTRFSSALYH